VTFEQRLQQCFIFSEKGNAPQITSQTILALSAYAHWMAQGQPIGAPPPGAGLVPIPAGVTDGDPVAGQSVYTARCAACHGASGQGLMQAGKTIFPPLWGLNSYTKGAGMSNPEIAARFILANMPEGGPALAPQDAVNVAAYIDTQWRAPDPRKGILGWLP
jgi:thiosulfate dehydrogenase